MSKFLIVDPFHLMPSLHFTLKSDESEVYYISNIQANWKRKDRIYSYEELKSIGVESFCLENKEQKNELFSAKWDCVFLVSSLACMYIHDKAKRVAEYYYSLAKTITDDVSTDRFVVVDSSDEPLRMLDNLKEDGIRPDLLFKKEYNRNVENYPEQCKPFPFVVMGKPDVLRMINERKDFRSTSEKEDRVWWAGAPSKQNDIKAKSFFDRVSFLNGCKGLVTQGNKWDGGKFASNDFMKQMSRSKYFLYLRGNAKLTRRLFEGLSTGSLMMMENPGVTFNFFGNGFARETIFDLPEEFERKLQALREDDDLYRSCLEEQERVIRENFTYKAVREYIRYYVGV